MDKDQRNARLVVEAFFLHRELANILFVADKLGEMPSRKLVRVNGKAYNRLIRRSKKFSDLIPELANQDYLEVKDD